MLPLIVRSLKLDEDQQDKVMKSIGHLLREIDLTLREYCLFISIIS